MRVYNTYAYRTTACARGDEGPVYCASYTLMVHSAPMQTEETARTIYELSYHLPVSLTEKDQEAVLDVFRKEISKAGGVFLAEGALEEADLAYPMKAQGSTHTKSFFGWMKFELDPASAKMLQTETIPQEKRLIRAVLIQTVREDTRASAQARSTNLVQEVENKGVLERKVTTEETPAEVSEEAIDKSIDDLVTDKAY